MFMIKAVQGIESIQMASNLMIQCDCGELRGVASAISPQSGNHVACYCDDCQAFAHFLNRAKDVLDSHGGSDIFQMSQGQIAITSGVDKLACVRLTPKGLVRWFASCCNSPIGSTMSTAALPLVGLVTNCLRASGEKSVDEQLGPVKASIYRKFAKDGASLPPDRVALPIIFLGVAALLVKWILRRNGKRSPFFDPTSGSLAATPRVLTELERAALRTKTGAPQT